MIIDVWMQHPTTRHSAHECSTRFATGRKTPPPPVITPEMTVDAMDRGGRVDRARRRLVRAGGLDDLERRGGRDGAGLPRTRSGALTGIGNSRGLPDNLAGSVIDDEAIPPHEGPRPAVRVQEGEPVGVEQRPRLAVAVAHVEPLRLDRWGSG
jgi:hypothetical protein